MLAGPGLETTARPVARHTAADRDYVIILSEWRIIPGTARPVTTEMMEFNILTMNSKAFPGTHPLLAKVGERACFRLGNLFAIDHHPTHLHGFQAMPRIPAFSYILPVSQSVQHVGRQQQAFDVAYRRRSKG